MSSIKHALFVCTGNTCRSPMAEALFRHAITNRNDLMVSSAGVAAYPGSPASHETILTLKNRGISLQGFKSRPVTHTILHEVTHVFAMTQSHLAALESHFPSFRHKFYLLGEFAVDPDSDDIPDVPDPIGCGIHAYEEVASVFEIAVPAIISFIDQDQE